MTIPPKTPPAASLVPPAIATKRQVSSPNRTGFHSLHDRVERSRRSLATLAQKIGQKFGDSDYCPLYIHWSPWSVPDAGQQLRLWASHHQVRGRWPFLRWVLALALTITWPLRAGWLIGQNLRQYAPVIAKRTGKPVWRQGLEQLWLAFRHSLPPVAYYHYELYRPAQRPLVDQYIHQYEASSLLPYLNRHHRHPAIDNKVQFAFLCAIQGLPTVPIWAVCKGGNVIWQATATGDLFVKPVTGARGEGANVWQRLDADRYQKPQGEPIPWAALLAMLAKMSQTRDYLVQPRLYNHPAIADLSPCALATARIVTGRTLDGAIEVIAATFKMAWHANIINTHGLNSAIDLATGVLGRAYSYHPLSAGVDQHPVTGAPITGRRLPDWAAAVALAQRAHQQFPGYVFLGWDVALVATGPLLLEGNAGWDVLTVQKPQHTPLAQTRFATISDLWMQVRRT